ncbi:hypothetical protein CONLIGDRAFT_720024 [Coniochaeta ligniaria NRRL 30616]|uniref:C2H2-type domain-containing protein n=1 Tax=Coniochaeta ligniaria NRRL 30616 TaxID=1408157 RepID=A0A1J7IZA6_9PEZI|nr:hypothetical protein CONLIGDRAFT_720024 [Coniochaeta ligniaria NRRL 30616]
MSTTPSIATSHNEPHLRAAGGAEGRQAVPVPAVRGAHTSLIRTKNTGDTALDSKELPDGAMLEQPQTHQGRRTTSTRTSTLDIAHHASSRWFGTRGYSYNSVIRHDLWANPECRPQKRAQKPCTQSRPQIRAHFLPPPRVEPRASQATPAQSDHQDPIEFINKGVKPAANESPRREAQRWHFTIKIPAKRAQADETDTRDDVRKAAPPQYAPPASHTVMIHDDDPARSQAPELTASSQRAPRKITNCIYCRKGFKSKGKLLKHVYADTCKRGSLTGEIEKVIAWCCQAYPAQYSFFTINHLRHSDEPFTRTLDAIFITGAIFFINCARHITQIYLGRRLCSISINRAIKTINRASQSTSFHLGSGMFINRASQSTRFHLGSSIFISPSQISQIHLGRRPSSIFIKRTIKTRDSSHRAHQIQPSQFSPTTET